VMKAHKITNCVLALQHLKEENVGHLTVSAENFVNSDERDLPLILGFCWQLLRKYQNLAGSGKNTSYEQGLLDWLRSVLKDYGDINLDDNYKSLSFQDGKVWLGLVNEFQRGLIDYPSYKSENKYENCATAFTISEQKLNIPSLIDPLEMSQGKTSDKNIVLYLSLWYNAFKEKNQGVSREELARRIAELEEAIRRMMAENEELRRRLASGIDQKANQAELDMQEIIRMLEELMRLRDGMKKENQELAERNRLLRERLEKENREREQLEKILCEKMEREGGAVSGLRRKLVTHVTGMHGWKEFLQQDRKYDSFELNVRLESSLAKKDIGERVQIVDKQFNEETALLEKLLGSRKAALSQRDISAKSGGGGGVGVSGLFIMDETKSNNQNTALGKTPVREASSGSNESSVERTPTESSEHTPTDSSPVTTETDDSEVSTTTESGRSGKK